MPKNRYDEIRLAALDLLLAYEQYGYELDLDPLRRALWEVIERHDAEDS